MLLVKLGVVRSRRVLRSMRVCDDWFDVKFRCVFMVLSVLVEFVVFDGVCV